jgi:flagellar biosynthetic protein FliR
MQFVIDHNFIEAVALAAIRVLCFLIVAPPFAHKAIPMPVKTILSVLLAVVIAPHAGAGYVAGTTGEFILSVFLQAATGALLGFLVYGVYVAVEAAGSLLDAFDGFQMAQQYDPTSQVMGAQFAHMFQMAALMLLFTTDAYQVVIAGIARSFTAVPLGGTFGSAAEPHLLEMVTNLLVSAIQIAGPISIVLFLVNVGLGLLTRIAPALQAFSLGPPALALMTIVMVAVGFTALPMIVTNLTGQVTVMLGGGL